MQLRSESADVISGGKSQGRQANFTIGAMNAKVFDMLSSSIYSNKVRAVVREYSTNALDGHIAAGCPERPFLVQLPTEYESVFKVRDFGSGLTDDQMFEIFSSYFVSTKTDSNDVVGGFGIGSKCGFALVDSFQVRCFQNGKMRSYTCFKQNGIPNIEMILETDTEEENGVEISIPVDYKDITRFEREAAFVYSAFDVKPIIDGIPDFEQYYLPMEKTGCAGFYGISRYNQNHMHNHDFGGDVVVKMGPVFYALNGECRKVLVEDSVINILRGDVNTLVIEADIGDLDIPPSRELIDNTEHNIEMMRTILERKTKPFVDELVAKYDSIKDLLITDAEKVVDSYPVSIRNYIRNRKDFVFSTFFGQQSNISSYDDVYAAYRKTIRIKYNDICAAKNAEDIVVKDSQGNDVLIKRIFKPYLRKYDGSRTSGKMKKIFSDFLYNSSMYIPSHSGDKGITIYTITDKTAIRIQENYSKIERCSSGSIWLCDTNNEEEMFVVELLKELFCGDIKLAPLDNTNAPLPKNPKVSSVVHARGEKPHNIETVNIFCANTGTSSISINELKEKDEPFVWVDKNTRHSSYILRSLNGVCNKSTVERIKLNIADFFDLPKNFTIMVLPENLQKHAEANPNAIKMDQMFEHTLLVFLQTPVWYDKENFDIKASNAIMSLPDIKKQVIFSNIHKVSEFNMAEYVYCNRMIDVLEEIIAFKTTISEQIRNYAQTRLDEINGTIVEQARRINQVMKKYPMLQYVQHSFDSDVISEYIQKVDYVNTIRGENA